MNGSGTDPGRGGWVDLSHPLNAEAPRVGTFPAPRLRKLLTTPGDPMNVTAIEICCHVGTHIDAPVHFVHGGETVGELGLDRLTGPGRVLRVKAGDDQPIDAVDLERTGAEVESGEIVLLDSGWSAHAGGERYERHPYLTLAAADWLVEREVKLLGIDFPTPDLPLRSRPAGFDWPVHRRLLGSGVLIAEHLTDLGRLPDGPLEVACLPVGIEGADGAPARIVARAARS